jgi:hypothetical protein
MACSLAFSSISVRTNAGSYNPDNLPADQVSNAGQICQSIMRLEPFEAHYQGCLASLMDSAKALNQGRALQHARADCLEKGLRSGEPGFAECELQSTDVHRAQGGETWPVSGVGIREPSGSKSYFYASPRDVFQREQMSCARLGFDPADGAFGSCVASLQSSMFEADHPAQ